MIGKKEDNDRFSQTARWIAVEAMASITEILFAIFPVRLVRGLQMHTNTKLEVVIGVWARLPYASAL